MIRGKNRVIMVEPVLRTLVFSGSTYRTIQFFNERFCSH